MLILSFPVHSVKNIDAREPVSSWHIKKVGKLVGFVDKARDIIHDDKIV